MRLRHLPLPIALLTACFVLVNCSSRERDCTEPEIRAAGGVCSADTAGEAGTEGGTDGGFDVIAPPGCDLTKDPKDSPACVDTAVGIFVSPTGDDSASGSKELPVRTIKRGLELASSKALPRVYVCEGTYDANLEITSPVSLYGGLSCAWAHTGAKPKIAPAKGVALRVTNANGAVLVADLEVAGAADANKAGDSAIAAFVAESKNVTLRGTTLVAGAGTAGRKGSERSNYTGANATKGGDATGSTGGNGPTCTCTDGTSSMGGGGAAGNGGGLADGTSMPAVGSPNAGLNGTASCGPGSVGANGVAKPAGQAWTAPGVLTSNGWGEGAKPSTAPNGNPGQGGGGGGAKMTSSSAGGGGACGGCGGAGGEPGTSGGSSFALLSFNSQVTIEGGLLSTGAGGDGGGGGNGQAGQGGGPLGVGACDGGPGGSGAGGSGGGGGAGGHSAPIAFVGSEPKVTGATLTSGTKGAAGGGGAAGLGPGNAGAAGALGAEGKAQNVLAL